MSARGMFASMAVVPALTGALTMVSGPAMAERWEKRDPTGDTRAYADIVKVQADHEPKNLWVRATFKDQPYHYTNVRIDTDPRHRGAEFEAQAYWAWDGLTFNIRRGGGKYFACKGGRAVHLGRPTVQLRIPRACLLTKGRKPSSLRMRVESLGEEFYWVHDAVPGRKKFGPWLGVA